jgi:ribose transport system ATP-binding protein
MAALSLQAVEIRKEYPGTVALRNASLEFRGGTIHVLVGKNGAGKSTLVKILTGAVTPTSGTLLLNGSPIHLRTPADALRNGIHAVYQELSLVPDLSVAENILLGRLPQKLHALPGTIDWPVLYAHAGRHLHELGVNLDVHKPVRELSVAQQQLVEIAKAMSQDPAVLLLDEPTSALSRSETEHLFQLLRMLADRGVAMIYVTHRLQEIQSIGHVVTALRDGDVVGTFPAEQATPARLVEMMFGESVARGREVPPLGSPVPVMHVEGLSRGTAFSDVHFTLHRGEILGIAGVLGAGRTELLRAIFGADRATAGSVRFGDTTILPGSPEQMKRLGIALAPENRKDEGLVQILSTQANICLASLERIGCCGITTRRRDLAVAERRSREVDLVTPDMENEVSSLSGGNQQKVVLGKWLNTEPRVLLLDEPTRGIDVKAKRQIFQILWNLSKQGISSLVVSSELEELLDLCHRIIVMRGGRITGEIDPANSSLEQLFSQCMQ